MALATPDWRLRRTVIFISIAELFHITLDYLVCGCERKAEVDDLLVGLKEKEVQFIRNMVLNAVDNMKLLTE